MYVGIQVVFKEMKWSTKPEDSLLDLDLTRVRRNSEAELIDNIIIYITDVIYFNESSQFIKL